MSSRRTGSRANLNRLRLAASLILVLAGVAAPLSPALSQTRPAADILLEVKRFEIVGANPLSDTETAATLAPHLGIHRNLSTLEAAATALESRLRERGFSFHRVIIPAQKPAEGVVKLEILQFPLASVGVVGNRHFSAENIRRSMPALVTGSSPDVREISRELGLANEHASKRISVVLKESVKSDALDAEIRVGDVAPAQTFVSLTGNTKDAYDAINKSTGYTRLTLGYQHANLFDLDHAITLTYTTSPEHSERVQQYGAFYWMPLYGYATSLQLYYTRSDINTGAIGLGTTSFNVSGKGEFMGARLTHSLPKLGDMTQNVWLAFDDRLFQSNVDVAGFALAPTPVRSRPLSLRYTVRMEQPWGMASAYGEQATNLSGGSGNTDADYAAVRAGSSRDWSAFRFGLDASYALAAWNLSARLRGQYADTLLIPGEQFGLGGVASVRGLREREFTGDSGYAATLEALGPPLLYSVRPVFFFDHGHARLRGATVLPGTTVNNETASSIGVGVRWNRDRRIDVSADLAYVLNGIASSGTIPGTSAGDLKLTFTVFYRF